MFNATYIIVFWYAFLIHNAVQRHVDYDPKHNPFSSQVLNVE